MKKIGLLTFGLSTVLLQASFFSEYSAKSTAKSYINSNYDCIKSLEIIGSDCSSSSCLVEVVAKRYPNFRNSDGSMNFTRCDDTKSTVNTYFKITTSDNGKEVISTQVRE